MLIYILGITNMKCKLKTNEVEKQRRHENVNYCNSYIRVAMLHLRLFSGPLEFECVLCVVYFTTFCCKLYKYTKDIQIYHC